MLNRITYLIGLAVSVVFVWTACGYSLQAQTATDADIKAQISSRLTSLSKYLDGQAKILQLNAAAISGALTSNVGKTPNTTKTVSNFALHGMGAGDPSALNNILIPKQLDVLDTNREQIQSFSNELKSIIADLPSMTPEMAFQRLDKIGTPQQVQELLALAPDGQKLPPPAHLDVAPASGGTAFSPFVIGPGSVTTVQYPSVANIAYSQAGQGHSTLCTGTLISSDTILTAAHCFCKFSETTTGAKCLASTYKRGAQTLKATDTQYFDIFFQDAGPLPVKEIIINPAYDFPKQDLAIVRLTAPVTGIMPAPLNDVGPVPAGEVSTVVGFGVHSPLNQTGTPLGGSVVDSTQGLKLWARIRTAKCTGTRAQQDLICWSYQPEVADQILGSTCYGDSGGPLFAKFGKQWKLAGVTSGGATYCIASTKPNDQSFDVEVFKNLAWIRSASGIGAPEATAATSTAFISDPGMRAYEVPYHLFINLPDSLNSQFTLPPNLKSVRVSINSTPTFSSLTLELSAPDNTKQCSVSSNDSYVTCIVPNPPAGTWTAKVTGSRPQETQAVGTLAP